MTEMQDAAASSGRQPAGPPVVITLADGETRKAERDATGSYECPFCGSITWSPQGWGDLRSYSPADALAYQSDRCANPVCQVNMTVASLAAWRRNQARTEAEHELRSRVSASMAAGEQRATAERAAQWERLSAQAQDADQCLDCLRFSLRKGQARLVRHRDPANCPVPPRWRSAR